MNLLLLAPSLIFALHLWIISGRESQPLPDPTPPNPESASRLGGPPSPSGGDLWGDAGGGQLVTDTDPRAVASVQRTGPQTFKITIQRLGGHPWDVRWRRRRLPLENGRRYEARFAARADRTRPMEVDVQRDFPAYQMVGLSQTVPLTTAWRTFRLPFQARGAVPGRSALQFDLGQAPGAVWLSDITLVPVGTR